MGRNVSHHTDWKWRFFLAEIQHRVKLDNRKRYAENHFSKLPLLLIEGRRIISDIPRKKLKCNLNFKICDNETFRVCFTIRLQMNAAHHNRIRVQISSQYNQNPKNGKWNFALLTDIVSFPAPIDVDASNRFQSSKNSRTYRRCLSTIRNPVMFRAVYSTTFESHWSSVTYQNHAAKSKNEKNCILVIVKSTVGLSRGGIKGKKHVIQCSCSSLAQHNKSTNINNGTLLSRRSPKTHI